MLSGKGITKTYGKSKALDNASVEIMPGETVMVLGKNGSGKSTLMSILAKARRGDSGEISLDDLTGSDLVNAIGYVPQDISLFDDLTVEENIRAFSRQTGADLQARIDKIYEQLGLMNEKKKLVRNLSGGQKRRVNLAVALINKPRYLILDEPLAGVDTESEEHILKLLREYVSKGTGLMISSHQPRQLKGLADKCLKLEHGKTVYWGSAEKYFSELNEREI